MGYNFLRWKEGYIVIHTEGPGTDELPGGGVPDTIVPNTGIRNIIITVNSKYIEKEARLKSILRDVQDQFVRHHCEIKNESFHEDVQGEYITWNSALNASSKKGLEDLKLVFATWAENNKGLLEQIRVSRSPTPLSRPPSSSSSSSEPPAQRRRLDPQARAPSHSPPVTSNPNRPNQRQQRPNQPEQRPQPSLSQQRLNQLSSSQKSSRSSSPQQRSGTNAGSLTDIEIGMLPDESDLLDLLDPNSPILRDLNAFSNEINESRR